MNFSAQSKAFALLLSVGLVAGCSSTGGTSEEGGEYGSDVAAVDQEGGSTVYGGDDQGGVSSSAMLSLLPPHDAVLINYPKSHTEMVLKDITNPKVKPL